MLNTHHIKREDLGGLDLFDGSDCMKSLLRLIYYVCLITCSLCIHVQAFPNAAAYLRIEGGLLISEDYLCSWLGKNDLVRIYQILLK